MVFTIHSVSLTTSCLSICKYSRIVPIKSIIDNIFCYNLIDLFLTRLWLKYIVKFKWHLRKFIFSLLLFWVSRNQINYINNIWIVFTEWYLIWENIIWLIFHFLLLLIERSKPSHNLNTLGLFSCTHIIFLIKFKTLGIWISLLI